jgi:tetratricopeptide (TPR) repeat protein
MNDAEIRARILRSAADIVGILLRSDTVTIDHAVKSLVQGANGYDFQRSGASLFLLKSLVLHPDADGARAINGLPLVTFDRAIPLLDTLLDKRSQSPIASRLREQLEHMSAQAEYDALNHPNPAKAMGRLRDVLDSIKTKPANFAMVRAQAEELIRNEESGRSAVTLRRIAADPQAEGGYQELLQHLAAEGGYRRAVVVFDSLKREYAGSLWPAKILASIYHENLPAEAGAFEKSYQEMKSLEELAAYAELPEKDMERYRRIRADFSEITLSARRYAETEQLAEEILEDTGSPEYHRLNAALFVLIGRVMQGDSARADSAIGSLERIVQQLPNDFYNNWEYPGTVVFIRRSDLPEATKDALLALCQGGFWLPKQKAGEVLARNRMLLGTRRSGRLGSVR